MTNVTTGLSIAFATGFFAKITDFNWEGINRAVIDTSHMGTAAAGANKFGNRTKIFGKLVDGGKLGIEIQFDPATNPPIADAVGAFTVTWPDGETWEGNGGLSEFSIQGPLDDLMVANCTLDVSGEVTMTD